MSGPSRCEPVNFQSFAEVFLDTLPVIPQQVTGLGVLLVVTTKPVLNTQVLYVVLHLLRVLSSLHLLPVLLEHTR